MNRYRIYYSWIKIDILPAHMETKIFAAVDSIILIQYVKISLDLCFQPLLSPWSGPLLNHINDR